MSEEEQKLFDEDYVKGLRQEAANWRKQFRDLEKEVTDIRKLGFESQVKMEFATRGIQAEPGWLNMQDGESIPEAIERFTETYPHLVAQQPPVAPQVPFAQPPNPSNANSPGPPAQGQAWWSGKLEDIKQDPVARKSLQDYWWQSTHQAQYTGSPEEKK